MTILCRHFRKSLYLIPMVSLLGLVSVSHDVRARPLTADFNGDGFDDLAVAVPSDGFGEIIDAGSVQVIYGSANRLAAAGSQRWHQSSPGIKGGAERGDRFGSALSVGDFNGDGFDDLAIGVAEEDIGSIGSAGAVNVIYGSANRLSARGDQIWHQDSPGIADVAEPNDFFGSALSAGDFNGDGFDDLAVGVRREQIGPHASAGAVNVIYGTASGLSDAGGFGNQVWHQNRFEIQGDAARGDNFGAALTAGDFNGDGFDDLAIGVPFEDIGSIDSAGAVNVIYGSNFIGLFHAGNQRWHQNTGIQDSAGRRNSFGFALGAGDFNSDGFDDLAIGVPFESFGGAVNVLYGTQVRLLVPFNQFWHQDIPGIPGGGSGSTEADQFGAALAVSDFNGDGFDDLAVGAPAEGLESPELAVRRAGAVTTIYGSAIRLSAAGSQQWHQNLDGIEDNAEAFDNYGAALGAGDFDGDGLGDLAVGVPQEDLELVVDANTGVVVDGTSIVNAGAVSVLYGLGPNGLSDAQSQLWHQDVDGIAGLARRFDQFGDALIMGQELSLIIGRP